MRLLFATWSATVVLGVCWLACPASTSRCDDSILAAINNYPKNQNIILTGLRNIREIVVATSPNYYNPSPRCAYSFFTLNSFFLIKEQSYGCPTIEEHPLHEVAPGLLIEPDTGIRRYHFIEINHMTGFYKCDPNGQPGIAEGLIKVRAGSFNFKDLQRAINIMKSMGISIQVQYPSQCP